MTTLTGGYTVGRGVKSTRAILRRNKLAEDHFCKDNVRGVLSLVREYQVTVTQQVMMRLWYSLTSLQPSMQFLEFRCHFLRAPACQDIASLQKKNHQLVMLLPQGDCRQYVVARHLLAKTHTFTASTDNLSRRIDTHVPACAPARCNFPRFAGLVDQCCHLKVYPCASW